ncbi:Cytochrome c oxidase subunit 4 [Tulasnella sp. UAMH 9824]|nr:Cytochrome c oxidase subunit 4 [Tulasnella sp. UAMH 9824]
MLSSFRAVASRAVRPSSFSNTSIRALSATARIRSADHHGDHHAPVISVGPGAKPGEVATDENQATGLERYQVLGQHKGVDVFDMQGILVTRQGTLKDPIIVPTFSKYRQIGCTGFPVDSHDTIWLAASTERENTRCPECGNVYKLQQVQMESVEEGGHSH